MSVLGCTVSGPEILQDLLPVNSKPQTYRRHQRIGIDGDRGLSMVQAGYARSYLLLPDSSEIHIDFHGPSDSFGYGSLYSLDAKIGAVACTDCEVFYWSAQDLARLLQARPPLATALNRLFTEANERLLQRISELQTLPVRARLLARLRNVTARFGLPEGKSTRLPFGITHEVMATAIGTSREIISTCMAEFRREGILEYSRTSIRLAFDGETIGEKRARLC
jgi:CRP-like cAMP-binding protein